MKLIDFLNENDRFARMIGAQLTEVREGYARAEMTVAKMHLNGGGVCQGGALFTLADLAIAALTEARKQTSNEVLERNREMLLNGKIKQFSNSPLAEAWYALMLEEPKTPKIQQAVRYR